MNQLEEIIAFFHCLPNASLLVAPDAPHFTVKAVNQAFSLLNPEQYEQIHDRPFDLVFPFGGEPLAHAKHALAEVLHRKRPRRLEEKIFDELSVRSFSIDTFPLFNSDGNVNYIILSFVEQSLHFMESKQLQSAEHLERHHDLFNFSPMPMWVYDVKTGEILAANKAACRDYGYSLDEFLGANATMLMPPDYQPKDMATLKHRASLGWPNHAQVKYQTKSGKLVDVEITAESLPTWNQDARIVVAVDITEKLKAARLRLLFDEANELERNILELHSKTDVPTTSVLTAYLIGLEKLMPELTCTIMQVRNDRIYNWSAPNFPASLAQAFSGLAIGPLVGSCGTAAYYKRKIIVADIREDQGWEAFRDMTLDEGFQACWSYPVIDSSGNVMGTFALYKHEPAVPNEHEEQLIERAISLLTVILENRTFAAILTETSELMKQGQSLARFGNWSWEVNDNVVTWSDELFEIYGIRKEAFQATFEGYQQLLHQEDRDRVVRLILSALTDQKSIEFEANRRNPASAVMGKIKM